MEAKAPVRKLSHAKLVKHAERWLRTAARCSVVMTEQTATGEVPDAIGWKKTQSTLVECKISRADFLADSAKPWRCAPEQGLGQYRYYLAPEGMLSPAELPAGWGLLEVDGAGRVRRAKKSAPFKQRNAEAEIAFLVATLARVGLRVGDQGLTEWLKFRHRMLQYNGGLEPGRVGIGDLGATTSQ